MLAVASGGGHWIQLLRLRPALDRVQVTYVTTRADNRPDVAHDGFRLVPEASRWDKRRAVWCALCMAQVLIRERPDAIITTGALPGYLAVRIGKLLKTPSIWVDSMANVDELSMSGRRAASHVDMLLTQWEHLATPDGPARYVGSVIG